MKKAKNKPIEEEAKKAELEKIEIKPAEPKEKKAVLLEWQSPEFEYKEKDVSWYWTGLIVSICLLAVAVWQKNFLFAVFVVVAYLAVIYSAGQKPLVWKFTLNEKGVGIDPQKGKSIASKFYKYEEIAGFDIFGEENEDAKLKYKELVLKTKKKISPYLKINFSVEKEKEIKEFLAKYLPEEEYTASISDSISKLIGF